MVADSEKFKEEDERTKERVDAKNKCESTLYSMKDTLEKKEVNGNQCVEVGLVLMGTQELADPTSTKFVAKEGDTTSILCGLANEYGRGELKNIATPIGAALGLAKISDVVEQATDIECLVVTTLQQDKNDKDKFRTKIKELAVV